MVIIRVTNVNNCNAFWRLSEDGKCATMYLPKLPYASASSLTPHIPCPAYKVIYLRCKPDPTIFCLSALDGDPLAPEYSTRSVAQHTEEQPHHAQFTLHLWFLPFHYHSS